MPRGKFDSTNQRHYPDLGGDASSVWNLFLRLFLRLPLAGKPVVASPNAGCFLRLHLHRAQARSLCKPFFTLRATELRQSEVFLCTCYSSIGGLRVHVYTRIHLFLSVSIQAVCALRSRSIMGGIQNLIICVKMAWSEHLDCGVNIR